jgi:hypothetical protein
MSEAASGARPMSMSNTIHTKPLVIVPDSHVDHIEDLSPKERATLMSWLQTRVHVPAPPTASVVRVLTFHDSPVELLSELRGPAVGDEPVPDADVEYRVRRGRKCASRRMKRHVARWTRTVTVVVGPHGSEDNVLYTVYGGPRAPREPGDASINTWEELEASREFWAQHALS